MNKLLALTLLSVTLAACSQGPAMPTAVDAGNAITPQTGRGTVIIGTDRMITPQTGRGTIIIGTASVAPIAPLPRSAGGY